MAIKKSDLYSSIWASCDELGGGMDARLYWWRDFGGETGATAGGGISATDR
jgi:hypothetical protein